MKETLLILDDDAVFGHALKELFADKYTVSFFSDPEDAVRHIREASVDVALIDLIMPKMNGIEVLNMVKTDSYDTDIVVMTAYASVDTAVEAMRKGACDYIIKPFEADEVSLRIERIFEKRRISEENANLKRLVDTKFKPEEIIGENDAMKNVYRFIERVAQKSVTVLITGESGTGKELVAKAIHCAGKRRDKKFVSICCSAMPETLLESELFGYVRGAFTGAQRDKAGLFEYADGGTIFLDEIGDASLAVQTKLLRVMQDLKFRSIGSNDEITVDVRIICATNRNLKEMVKENKFREDLYYRINVVSIHIPPLGDRRDDISRLVSYFLEGRKKIHPKAMSALVQHNWPGNVRELKNMVERLVTLTDSTTIYADDLPPEILQLPCMVEGDALSYNELKKRFLNEFNCVIINRTLSKHNGNATRAAEELGIARENFHRLMKKCKISLQDFKGL